MNDKITVDVNCYQNRIAGEYNHILVPELTDETTGDSVYPWWHDFIYALCLIEYNKSCLQKLTFELKTYYAENTNEMDRIIEFENTYVSSDAVKWYTRPIFLYRVLNQALRQRNIRSVSKFGFFLKDLYKQLMVEHLKYIEVISQESIPLKCYRGQIMSQSEIQLLRNQRFRFQANSMLSTTSDRQIASLFLQPSSLSDEFQSVLLEITFNSGLFNATNQPFANISNLSFIKSEDEILFMAGTKFDLYDLYYDEDEKIWLADVRYVEHNDGLSEVDIICTEKAKLKQCIEKLGYHLLETSHDKKHLIFSELTHLCPSFSWISAIDLKYRSYVDTPFHKTANKEHMQKIKELESALSIWLTHTDGTDLDCFYEIGRLYRDIAILYQSIDNIEAANKNFDSQLIYYDKMIKEAEKTQDFRRVLASPNIYLECADNYESRMAGNNSPLNKINRNNALAYYEKLLNLTVRYCPENKLLLQRCYYHMAKNYHQNLNYDIAITFYEQFLALFDIQPNSNTAEWDFMNTTLQALSGMYYHYRRDYNSALKYQLKNYQLLLPCISNIPPYKIFQILMGLSQIYNALHQDDLVKENIVAAQKILPEHSIEELYKRMSNLRYLYMME